jgi:hypothetical protein
MAVSFKGAHFPPEVILMGHWCKGCLGHVWSVERSLCFRLNICPWHLVAKMGIKVVCKSLETGKRDRFRAKGEISPLLSLWQQCLIT